MTAHKPTPVPRLRFPEFQDAPEWSTPRGDTLFDSINNRSAAPGLPVLAITQEHGAIPRDQIDYHVSVTAESVASYKEVCEGDFIISLRSFQGGIEHSRYHGICSPAYVILRRKGGGNYHFFRHLFKSERFIQRLTSNIEGIRDGKMISYAQFSEQVLPVPEPPEQQKIADCLGSLDDLIAADGRKLEALRQHKQGLMQQLFPQPGETAPSLRFPEFHNDPEWEGKELGDVSEVLMCKRIFASETNPNGGVPFYKIGTLGGVPDAFISKDLFEEYKSKYNFPRTGEVLITCSGTVGKCLPYDGSEAYFQDSNIVWIDNSKLKVSNEFLLSILSNVNWSTLNSTTITRIYGPDLRGLAIKFPQNEKEQKCIADCLFSVDDLISAQAENLVALQTHKEGLLQQLFPSLESQ